MERNIWFAHKRFVGEHQCARMTLGFFEIIPIINTNKTSPEKNHTFVYRRLMDILLCGISKTENSTEPSGPPKAPRNSEHHSCLSGMAHDASAKGSAQCFCSAAWCSGSHGGWLFQLFPTATQAGAQRGF